MASTSGMEAASFWCHACSRLCRPRAAGEPVVRCARCGTPAAALEGIVDVDAVDARAFLDACHPEAVLGGGAPAPSLPAVTVRDAGRDCAVYLEKLEPGASAVVTPCEHVYHPPCIAPWLQSRAHVGGGGGDRDGLGRRIAGRIRNVRVLDSDGELVRPPRVIRGFKAVRLRARMAVGTVRRRDRVVAD